MAACVYPAPDPELLERCSGLGIEIPRSVIADLENGRRAHISVAELLVIACALDVPPVQLQCPVGREKEIEILPGEVRPSFRAAQWISGESPFPFPDSQPVLTILQPLTGAAAPLAAYRLNDAYAREQMSAMKQAQEYEQMATSAVTEGERDGWHRSAELERAGAARSLTDAGRLREQASARGWLPPEPVTQLQVVGDAEARVTGEAGQL